MNLFLLFQYGLVGTFVVLLATFLSVMVSDSVEGHISQLLGLHTKNLILKFLGIGMGGVLLALQAMMSYRRANALEDTVRNAEQGQRQERLKNAIEHLGHESDSVRLGGAYELFHLAEDTRDIRRTVFDILCAHIRQTTGEDEYRKKYPSKPSEEIQSLLTLLFVQEHKVLTGLHINLQGSWLNGADLQGAHLEKADLTKTWLQGAQLQKAWLQGAELSNAQLQRAMLFRTLLQEAHLWEACLQEAWLVEAWLQGANLSRAQLQGALLWAAHLQGALLQGACLQGARLQGACLQGTALFEAELQGAVLQGACLQGATSEHAYASTFEQRVRNKRGKESDLERVDFQGGLSQENIDSLAEGLSDERVKELREKLTPHVGKPVSHELPENSGAITGAYTAEEAEKWIAEYNKAMSEVPTVSDN